MWTTITETTVARPTRGKTLYRNRTMRPMKRRDQIPVAQKLNVPELAMLCSKLERENAELREKVDRLHTNLDDWERLIRITDTKP